VVTVRTHALLAATRGLLAQAGAALAVVSGACLLASLLVLASVVAASRTRQVYEATVMHVLGARLASLRRVLRWEYGLIGSVTALCGAGRRPAGPGPARLAARRGRQRPALAGRAGGAGGSGAGAGRGRAGAAARAFGVAGPADARRGA
jgi:hypothetical protein